MGIYDRDYYRKEGPSFLGSIATRAPVCKWLILINAAVFLVQLVTLQRDPMQVRLSSSGPFTDALTLSPQGILDGEIWRLLTYAFLHSIDNPWHILFNMVFLFVMGHVPDVMYGSREFLGLYVLSALFAGLCFFVHSLPMGMPSGLGASGAVSALAVVFAFHFPHRKVLLLFVIPMPIWLLVA